MRTIHYGICFVLVLIPVLLLYGCVVFFFHLTVQLPVLIMLPFTALGVERFWSMLKWMSPIIGSVDTKEQERTRTRIIEYELSRALRYGSHLTMAAIREKTRTSSHVIAKNLRNTDIVLRIPSGYLLVLMPDTNLEQAHAVVKRLNKLLTIKDVVLADEVMLQAAITTQKNSLKREKKGITAEEFRGVCIRAFDTMLAGIKSAENETDTDTPTIYTLFEPETVLEPVSVPMREFTCPLPSLEESLRRRSTRLLREA
jgi:hypothetical protein